MKQTSVEEIRRKAREYHAAGTAWHFHILTPTCALNKKDAYALIFECPEKNEFLVHYSDKAEKGIGEELSPMLHGAKALDKKPKGRDYKPPRQVQQIVMRMKQLNNKGVEWHHHVLFPGCVFNANSPKFTFVFEDPETGQKTENVTDEEPTADLKIIEPLFYKKQL